MDSANNQEPNKGEILKKPHPTVTFKVDQETDKQTAKIFLEVITSNYSDEHPGLQEAVKHEGTEKQQLINNYISKYYETYKEEIEAARAKFQHEWNTVESDFFAITDRVFDNHEWPSGDYIAYPSIFDCNPRYLESTTFQVYRNNVVGIAGSVAHEMLHFIFYYYFAMNEQGYIKELGPEKLWALSEVFDEIALEQPEYEEFKLKEPRPYKHLQPLAEKLRGRLNGKAFNIKTFITEAKQVRF